MVPFDPRQMAMNLISQNPNIANNPNAQEFIKVIQNGDSERGQQIADNLCRSYGMTRDDADPELRKRMKTDMTNLMASMN